MNIKLNVKLLIVTLIAGIIGAVLDVFLYNILVDAIPGFLLIPVLFVVLAFVISVTILVFTTIDCSNEDGFLFLEGKAMIALGLLVCMIILAGVSGLLQWIYESEVVKETGITSYIFILDESGSMDTNDPDNERFSAVESVMQSLDSDFPYAAYAFANECIRVREMAPASAGSFVIPADIESQVGSLTYICNALECVYNDIQSGALDAGERPQVILLTDGIANDMDTFLGSIVSGGEIVDDYAAKGIVISTVGLSGNVDEDLMEQIATKTNGNYVRVDHAAQLAQGFSSVASVKTHRNLLSERNMSKGNLLYALLRVLFLTLLGAMFAFIKAMASGKSDDIGLIMISGAIASLVGSLLLELGMAMGILPGIFRAVYLVLIAVTPGTMPFINSSMNYRTPLGNQMGKF